MRVDVDKTQGEADGLSSKTVQMPKPAVGELQGSGAPVPPTLAVQEPTAENGRRQ